LINEVKASKIKDWALARGPKSNNAATAILIKSRLGSEPSEAVVFGGKIEF